MTAPADTPPAPLDDALEPGEGGYPDEAQPCQLGGSHPATHSILFRDEDAYAPSCQDHDAEIRETLIEAGETIVGQVPIVAAIDDDPVTAAGPAVEVLDDTAGELRVRFPVVVIEGEPTSDGRYLTPGGLTHRALPLSILAQPESAHGGNDPGPAVIVGRIDSLTRTPGPDLVSRQTGEPFADGTFVWSGEGVIDAGHPVADMVRRRYLRGVSVDLVGMDYEVIGDEQLADSEDPQRRIVVHSAQVGALTLVALAAFADAYVELADEPPADGLAAPAELPDGLAASAFPAWRSAEVGDYPALVAAGEEHTGGMIALVPADPDALTVDSGLPADELHLTLAYLGDDVTGWDATRRDSLVDAMRMHAAERNGPITARVMAHAQFNPDGGPDGDHGPCAVYLVGDSDQIGPLRSAVMTEIGEDEDLPAQHEPFIAHLTAGYGIESTALTFTGPVVFDRIAVVLGPDWTYFPLGADETAEPAEVDEETVMAAAPPDPDLDEDAPMETGMPDAPQPCPLGEGGEHHAVRSLLYAGGAEYLPVCTEHDQDGRGLIEAEGEEISRVVDIREPDRLDAEEETSQ